MDRARTLRLVAASLFLLAVGHGVAVAQAPGAPPAVPPPDATAGLNRQVTLSPKEQVAEADMALGRMDSARSSIRLQLEEARKKRDVVKTLCLNDKLNQVDVAIRSARERKAALDIAASRSDGDQSNHEFTILGVLKQRTEQLTAEANQCIGNEVDVLGESSVNVTVEDLPAEDPSDYPDFEVVIEPPACASCIK